MNISFIFLPFLLWLGVNYIMESRGMFAIPENELIPRFIELERRKKKKYAKR